MDEEWDGKLMGNCKRGIQDWDPCKYYKSVYEYVGIIGSMAKV
jgi:hypothetical protein